MSNSDEIKFLKKIIIMNKPDITTPVIAAISIRYKSCNDLSGQLINTLRDAN